MFPNALVFSILTVMSLGKMQRGRLYKIGIPLFQNVQDFVETNWKQH